MAAHTEDIDHLLDRLAMVPERIARAVTGWDVQHLRAPLASHEWSAAELLAHLRASDAIWTWRLHATLVRDGVHFADLDERRWAEVADFVSAKFVSALTNYRLHRQDLIITLRRAAVADWRRGATHETAGHMTLLHMATHLLEHEEEHCAQLEAATH